MGIAIGTGTDVAMEAADVTLISGDLRGVARAIALEQKDRARDQAKSVLGLRLQRDPDPGGGGRAGSVCLGAPDFLRHLHPILAAAAMALSDVFVIGNSLRLRRTTA